VKLFYFVATDRVGHRCEGKIPAASREAAEEELHRRGYYAARLEETEEEGYQYPRAGGGTGPTLLGMDRRELVTYSIPVAAMIVGIAGIFVVLHFVKPDKPVRAPEVVVEEYFTAERAGSYEKQYALFSKGRQNYFSTEKGYARIRRERQREQLEKEGPGAPLMKVSSVEVTEKSPQRMTLVAQTLRLSGTAPVEFYLVVQKGEWRINYVRDPYVVETYLGRIDREGGYEKARDTVRLLKLETGLSDLEIEDLLRSYRIRHWQ